MDASEATTSAVPVAPFTDFTNLNMLFQSHYPTSPFFMNPLVLDKATTSLLSINYVNQKKLELISNDDSLWIQVQLLKHQIINQSQKDGLHLTPKY
ncbi:38176_t:CDS:2 [Gigaspora margarita]|uniref:38176_t:CDS:1 n=1 Tax=Gigaspora margarita TaxID=4874 RepID=A0ABM8W0U6_GIGMA|nr:38176_t:CDS:2 [Gigaspora margarita]